MMKGQVRPVPPSPWDLPDPRLAPPHEELLAVGADLEPGTVIDAYRRGLFPMPIEPEGAIGWWSPNPRCVIPLDGLRVTRSMARSARRLRATVDQDFDAVVRACGDPSRPHGWIDQQIRMAYGRLHRLGWAHSVEVWDDDGRLVGGVYGLEVGGLFAGESMFHLVTDASKVALMALVGELVRGPSPELRVFDVQWISDHLARLGAVEWTRAEYVSRIGVATTLDPILGRDDNATSADSSASDSADGSG